MCANPELLVLIAAFSSATWPCLLRPRHRPQSWAVKLVRSPLQVLKLINNFFTIPDRPWPRDESAKGG
jgi:hypothetical protein